MKKLFIILSAVCIVFAQPVFADTCFFMGEITTGSNKICYYDCLGGMVAINVSFVDICPITIETEND